MGPLCGRSILLLALQDATSKFVRRFQFIEEKAKAQGLSLEDMSLAEMDAIWG